MDRKSMKLVAVAGLSALCACAGLSRDARQEPLERFDEHGVGTAVLKVEALVPPSSRIDRSGTDLTGAPAQSPFNGGA